MGQDGLNLRAEEKCLSVPVIVEGFDTETIASRKQTPVSPVPDCEGEHTAQILHAISPVLLIQVDNGFGVALCAIAVTATFEIPPQLLVVVNLAVEDNPGILVFVRNGLMPSL